MPKKIIDSPKLGPLGLTQRQENFALAYCRTGDPIAAYKASYKAGGKPATIASECNKLLHRDDIKARIVEIRRELAERCEITIADIVGKLYTNATEARDKGQFSASNQALIAIGNHLGAFEPKADAGRDNPLARLTPDERRMLREAVERERERRKSLAAAAVRSEPDDGSGAVGTLQ